MPLAYIQYIAVDIYGDFWITLRKGRFWTTLHSIRTTVPALTLTLTLAVPRARACPHPAWPRPPRLPAGQSISTLITLQFTIHRPAPLPAAKRAATRRPPRPLNLIPRRGRLLHRAPLRSDRQLNGIRRPAGRDI